MHTPWGPSQEVSQMAGAPVYWVITAGHGGIMIDRDWASTRLSLAARKLAENFGHWLCYEEDCDWAIPLYEDGEISEWSRIEFMWVEQYPPLHTQEEWLKVVKGCLHRWHQAYLREQGDFSFGTDACRVGEFAVPTGASVADLVRYEQEDLGNDLGIDARLMPYLETMNARKSCLWVTTSFSAALRYARDGGDEVSTVEFGPNAVCLNLCDGDDGFLVLYDVEDLGAEGKRVLSVVSAELQAKAALTT